MHIVIPSFTRTIQTQKSRSPRIRNVYRLSSIRVPVQKKDGPESEDICIVTRVSQHTFVFYSYSCPRVTIELDSLSTRRKYKRRRSRNKSKPIPRLLPCILDLLIKYTIHFACFIFRLVHPRFILLRAF